MKSLKNLCQLRSGGLYFQNGCNDVTHPIQFSARWPCHAYSLSASQHEGGSIFLTLESGWALGLLWATELARVMLCFFPASWRPAATEVASLLWDHHTVSKSSYTRGSGRQDATWTERELRAEQDFRHMNEKVILELGPPAPTAETSRPTEPFLHPSPTKPWRRQDCSFNPLGFQRACCIRES